MSLWKEVDAGGGWSYGYGEYMKTVAQLAAVEQKYRNVVNNLPSWIQNAASMVEQLGEQALAQYVGNLTQYTQVPTYYLWIKGPGGYKSLGGEWNLFTGGAAAMQSYFSSVFAPAVRSAVLTMATADAICIASRSAPGAWNPASSPQRLRTEALRAKGGGSSAAPSGGGGSSGSGAGGGFALPLAIGAALVLFLVLRR